MHDDLQMEEISSNSGRFLSRRKRKAIGMKGDISCCHTKCQGISKKHFTKPGTSSEINEFLNRDAGMKRHLLFSSIWYLYIISRVDNKKFILNFKFISGRSRFDRFRKNLSRCKSNSYSRNNFSIK